MPQSAGVAGRSISCSDIALPPPAVSVSQDREWCVVETDGEWRKIRFHDYDEIYRIPGLYEALFYDVLGCNSPATIRRLLQEGIRRAGVRPGDLRVLDLGAGNGMVGEELMELGVQTVVGVDIIPEAAEAARRDRRGVYQDYLVLDMTDIPLRDLERLSAVGFNCLACVAALGFGDIPPAAFANAFNLLERDGWVAFNIKSEFLTSDDPCGFADLIRRMIDNRMISIHAREEYEHRRATCGDPLLYTAVVAKKNRDIPSGMVAGTLPSLGIP